MGTIKACLRRLPEGWLASSASIAEALERELNRELSRDHLLQGRRVKVVAHRNGTDDVLCWHVDEPARFTAVHLTWSGTQQTESDHPWVEVDGTFDDFLTYESKYLGQ